MGMTLAALLKLHRDHARDQARTKVEHQLTEDGSRLVKDRHGRWRPARFDQG